MNRAVRRLRASTAIPYPGPSITIVPRLFSFPIAVATTCISRIPVVVVASTTPISIPLVIPARPVPVVLVSRPIASLPVPRVIVVPLSILLVSPVSIFIISVVILGATTSVVIVPVSFPPTGTRTSSRRR